MQLIRFSATPDGGSHFSEVELSFPEPYTDQFGNVYGLSNVFNPESAVIVDLPSGLDQDWHLAPNRQLVLLLTGVIEVETTEGETRRWSAGGMFMADDTTGKGHRTRVLEGPVTAVFMRMPEDFGFQEWAG
jgi:hypothetical protein